MVQIQPLYLASGVFLGVSLVLVWLGVRKREALDVQRLVAERDRQLVEAGIREILEREARSIAAAAERRRQLAQDAHHRPLGDWLGSPSRPGNSVGTRTSPLASV